MGVRSRSERAASERARLERLELLRRAREARLLRATGGSLGSDHQIVDFRWAPELLVPVRFDSIEAVEEFLEA